jgi:Ribosomal protein L7/L12 C-terminal domain
MIRCQFCHQDNSPTNVQCEHCGATLPRPGAPATATPEVVKQIQDLLAQGRKIYAIKLLREETGAGLKEAKDAVERFAAAHGLTASRGTGCLNMLLLVAMLIIELLLA